MKKRVIFALGCFLIIHITCVVAFASKEISESTNKFTTENINQIQETLSESNSDVSNDNSFPLDADGIENNYSISSDNTQMFLTPIVQKTNDGKYNKSESKFANEKERILPMSLMSSEDNPTIMSVYSSDFYADASDFNIKLGVKNAKDVRDKLKLQIIDENNNIIASQISVYYDGISQYFLGGDSSVEIVNLVYSMKLENSINPSSLYYVRYMYTGEYILQSETTEATIDAITKATIKSLDVIDKSANSYKLYLANAKSGETYKIYYRNYENDQLISKPGTVDDNKCITIQFGGIFDRWAQIYLCDSSASYYYDYLSYVSLYDFISNDSENNSSTYSGIWINDHISASAQTIWLSFGQKGFGYVEYNEADLPNINAYMLDMETGNTVATLYNKEFQDYGTNTAIQCELKANSNLDETHNYGIVCDDGYTKRLVSDFIVTSEKKILDVYFYNDLNDETNIQSNEMSSGITKFYTQVSSININDISNFKIELFDSNGNVVAISKYVKGSIFELNATKEIDDGDYSLKISNGTLTYTEKMTFKNANREHIAYQLARDVTVYNDKTYIGVTIQTSLDPANLKYIVQKSNGDKIEATYYRTLFSDSNNYKYFVVVANDSMTDVDYSNRAVLQIYNGNTFISPEYEGNVSFTVDNRTTQPFVYDEINKAKETVEVFIEGITDNSSKFNICAFDDVSETEKIIEASYDSSSKSIIIDKTTLNDISTKYPIDRGHGITNKQFYVEQNKEYVASFYSSQIGNIVWDDEFGFLNSFTKKRYVVLNLPSNTYDYYKLSLLGTNDLSKQQYKQIENGLIYELPDTDGAYMLFAQFKTSSGVESDIETSQIIFDSIAPTFDVLETNVPSVYSIDENNELEISIGIDASEEGHLHYALYDKNNNLIGYDREVKVYSMKNNRPAVKFYADEDSYEDAAKLVIYMTDNCGNKSQEMSYNISVYKKYGEYSSGTTYIKINNETGKIVEAKSTDTKINIPSEINGITITGIDEYAFIDNGRNVEISIPETITNINEFAFDDLYDFKLLVKENSVAHRFALTNDIDFEIVIYKKGDILTDGNVNTKDAVKLAQYLADWDVTLTIDEQKAADVVPDGKINSKDAVKLAQYLADWDVSLE